MTIRFNVNRKSPNPVIPHPNQINYGKELIEFNTNWKIITCENFLPISKFLKKEIIKILKWDLEISYFNPDNQERKENAIIITKEEQILKNDTMKAFILEERYSLEIKRGEIHLNASTDHGLFNGIQSFLQIIIFNMEPKKIPSIFDKRIVKEQPDLIARILLPTCKINDFPRFQYRGFMLDVGRHFHSVAQIKEILDIMAFFKLNRFHWHLTEDQGWRVEIKKWPKLTEIGSKRVDTQIGGFKSLKMRGKPHKGFYRQHEIQEVIQYAAERFIQIIPEIDIPGHSRAAIAAYPLLSCSKKPITVATKSGIFKTIYCAGQEVTYTFLEDVLTEITELFPSSIIHIGGDEAPKKNWKDCPKCQEKIKIEALQNEDALQVYLTNRIANFLKGKSKRIMGWNEIIGPELNDDAIIQYWMRNKEKVKRAMEKGHQVVNSNFFHYYLDYKYCLHPLKKVYEYEPMFSDISHKAQQNLLGIEGPLWTEWVPTRERLHWQVFPRLLAIAESAWTFPENKNYHLFKFALKSYYPHLRKLGLDLPKYSIIDPRGIKRVIQMLRVRRMPLV